MINCIELAEIYFYVASFALAYFTTKEANRTVGITRARSDSGARRVHAGVSPRLAFQVVAVCLA